MKDRYLNITESIDRLIDEYQKYGSLVVAYDFDNTVFDFHKKSDTFEKIIALLRQAKKQNCYLIVFTACPESQYEEIGLYLKENGIPFDSINEDAPFVPVKSSHKIYFNILLDDRAGLSEAFDILQITLNKFKDASN